MELFLSTVVRVGTVLLIIGIFATLWEFDVIRPSDLNPLRLLSRRQCHGNTQRCQYIDRPNDNIALTWRDKIRFWWTREDPDKYGLEPGAWWDRHEVRTKSP